MTSNDSGASIYAKNELAKRRYEARVRARRRLCPHLSKVAHSANGTNDGSNGIVKSATNGDTKDIASGASSDTKSVSGVAKGDPNSIAKAMEFANFRKSKKVGQPKQPPPLRRGLRGWVIKKNSRKKREFSCEFAFKFTEFT